MMCDCNHDDEWSGGPSPKKWAIKYTQCVLWAGLLIVKRREPSPPKDRMLKKNKFLPCGQKTWLVLPCSWISDCQSASSMAVYQSGLWPRLGWQPAAHWSFILILPRTVLSVFTEKGQCRGVTREAGPQERALTSLRPPWRSPWKAATWSSPAACMTSRRVRQLKDAPSHTRN